MRAGVLVAGALTVLAVGCADEPTEKAGWDPPRIVKWSGVGSAHMDSTVEQVHDVYGAPTRSEVLRLPVGTRYADRDVRRESYRVRGGRLSVTYVDGVARSFQTDSARYRTADGIRVGATLSRGRCRRNAYDSCEYKMGTFYFSECGNAWVASSGQRQVVIGMDTSLFEHSKGRIASIEFGDLNVVLYCF